VATALGVLATPSAADDLRGAVPADAWTTPRDARPVVLRRARTPDWASYVPAMPLPNSRAAWTSIAVTPTPFDLTSGEALTPARGRVSVFITRISDERFLEDLQLRRWDSDGEINIVRAELVSPRMWVRLGGRRLPAHVSASMHAYSLEHAVLDRLRNLVEEELLSADPGVIQGHDIGGRDLEIAGQDMLNSAPILKLRLAGKLHLPCTHLFRRPLYSALSLGVTTPAFGWSTSSGNESVQPDLTLAYRWSITRKWAFTGATTVTLPGTTERFDALDVETKDVLVGSHLQVEYWFNNCWSAALGFQYQTSYLDGTGLPMDEASTYATLGFMWRPNPRHVFHIIFSENPQSNIPSGAQRNFDNSQRDSDFALQIGWRFSL
jgi:hypothetical protein